VDHGNDEHDAEQPRDLVQRAVQRCAVAVQLVRADEHLKIPGHVQDHEADTDQPRDPHDDLLSDRRPVERHD
jgi:hypothetical protein